MSANPYYEGLKEGKIVAHKCLDCGKVSLKSTVCPFCGSRNLEKVEVKGIGKVISYTRIYVPPEHFEDKAPYYVVLVELNNGLRILGQFEGESISVGDEVIFKSAVETPIGVAPVFVKK
ncbi:MAG TPA: Zn-ribbon domain-containing OB-fold protein [Euryarchaeota archaeon]|nr:Zn-ribbon domain-containing OB-fold protein [Euryarchaeota archaeon]